MSNTDVNNLRQLLCLPNTPANRSAICAACLNDMMWDMAEAHITGLKAWADRQHSIAVALERHGRRNAEGAVYKECRFSIKDLSNANLRNAYLRYANLSNADLRHADLIYADLRHADLISADLSDANLSSADLRDAILISADLRNANLRNANLSSADLFGADLRNADLSYANLRNADLRHAKYNEHTLFPAGFDPVARELIEVSE